MLRVQVSRGGPIHRDERFEDHRQDDEGKASDVVQDRINFEVWPEASILVVGLVVTMLVLLFAYLIAQDIRTDSSNLHYLGKNEVVMVPGMRITAKTSVGTISVTATGLLTRTYTWEGASRSLEMDRREERWYGSLGLDYPGPGDHWKEHNGITRAVVEEGQQHLHSLAEFRKFVKDHSYHPVIYRNNGLFFCWGKVLGRRQLDVEVWQIVLNGRKPTKLPGANDLGLKVDYAPLQTPRIILAAGRRDLSALQIEIKRGANLNIRDAAGLTPLITAIRAENIGAVKALLEAGANANLESPYTDSPLSEAVDLRATAIAESLLDHGAKPDIRTTMGLMKGQTPLFSASMVGDLKLVQVLLSHGADPNVEDAQGETPLFTAASVGKSAEAIQVVKLLLDSKAEIDHRSQLGITPLMKAAMFDDFDGVRTLTERGANVNARCDAARRMYWTLSFSGGPGDEKAMKKLQQSGILDKLHEDQGGVLDLAQNKEISKYLNTKGAKSFAAEARQLIDQHWKLVGEK